MGYTYSHLSYAVSSSFLIVLYEFILPPALCESSPCLTSLPIYSGGCVVAHSEVLTWISLNIYWFWIHLLHLLATWISSFSAYFFKPFGLLKLWLFFLLICRFAGVLCEYFDRYKYCKYNSHSILSTNNFCYGSPNKLIYTL